MFKKIKTYKEKHFSSWLEFILTFGICPFNDGGYLLTIYGWGGALALFFMYLMLKYGIK